MIARAKRARRAADAAPPAWAVDLYDAAHVLGAFSFAEWRARFKPDAKEKSARRAFDRMLEQAREAGVEVELEGGIAGATGGQVRLGRGALERLAEVLDERATARDAARGWLPDLAAPPAGVEVVAEVGRADRAWPRASTFEVGPEMTPEAIAAFLVEFARDERDEVFFVRRRRGVVVDVALGVIAGRWRPSPSAGWVLAGETADLLEDLADAGAGALEQLVARIGAA